MNKLMSAAVATFAALFSVPTILAAPLPNTTPITMAIVNARIWTGNPQQPWAQAIALRGDRIAIVGTNEAVTRALSGVKPVDAHGQMVTPGFIDSHVHLIDSSANLASVHLRDAKTPAE